MREEAGAEGCERAADTGAMDLPRPYSARTARSGFECRSNVVGAPNVDKVIG